MRFIGVWVPRLPVGFKAAGPVSTIASSLIVALFGGCLAFFADSIEPLLAEVVSFTGRFT